MKIIIYNNIIIQAIGNTSSLPKPLKALLLNLAVSDLAVGLVAQPLLTSLNCNCFTVGL